MDEENFYYFIHSLDRGEKWKFSSLYGSEKGNNEIRLFKRILECRKWNNSTKERIRNAGFQKSAVYYNTRLKLAVKILKSLIHFDKSASTSFPFVEKAIQNKLLELAEKMVDEMLKEFVDTKDLFSLRYLYNMINRWENQYLIKLKLPESLFSLDYVQTQINELNSLDVVLRNLKALIKMQKPIEILLLKNYNLISEHSPTDSLDVKFKKDSIKYCINRLQGNLITCASLKERIVTTYHPGNSISYNQYLREVFSLVLLCSEIGDRDRASKYSLFFSKVAPNYLIEQEKLNYYQTSSFILIGKCFGILDFAEKGQEMMERNNHLFSTTRILKLQYLNSLIYFLNEDYSSFLGLVKKIERVAKSLEKKYYAEFLLLKVISHFEMENFETSQVSFQSAVRYSRKTKNGYALAVCSCLSKLFSLGIFGRKKFLSDCQNQLLTIEQAEVYFAGEIRFSSWFGSKLSGKSQAEIIREIHRIKLLQLKDATNAS